VKRWWLAAGLAALCGCGGQPAASAVQQTAAPVVRVAHRPPTPKDVIDAAIASSTVPLSVSPTCANAGTEPSDRTIGRYLSGFLAELSSPAKKNWVETKVSAGRSPAGEDVSICSLMLRHEDGDDRWGWGVQFQVRASDGVVLADSFTCLGAG
jgi:hypothetical protein